MSADSYFSSSVSRLESPDFCVALAPNTGQEKTHGQKGADRGYPSAPPIHKTAEFDMPKLCATRYTLRPRIIV